MFRLLLLTICFSAGVRAEDVLLVLLKGASALAYYSMDGKLLTKVPVGENPHEMVVTKDGRYVYITDNGTMKIEQEGKGGNTISVVDIVARRRVERISLGNFRRPHGIAMDPPTGRIAVTTELPDHLFILNAEERKVIRNFPTKGKTSHMVAFSPNKSGSEWALVSNAGDASVSAVHLTTGVVAKIPVGQRPEGSVLSRDGTLLFVCNRESASITIIDTARRAAIGEIKTGKGPVRAAITPDGRTLVYALIHDRKVEFADLETRRVVGQVALDGDPVSMSVSSDGQFAFASAQDQDTVYVVSVKDRKLASKFQTEKGAGPDPVLMVKVP